MIEIGKEPEIKFVDDLIDRIRDEADLCRNEGAIDVANLLDEAANALEKYATT